MRRATGVFGVVALIGGLGAASPAIAAPQTVDYTYDAIGRLTSATYDAVWVIQYEYDPNGNVLRVLSGPAGTGVDGGPTHPGLPKSFALGRSAPNPFTRQTRIDYQLPKASSVRLRVFDVSGRRVRTLVDGSQPAGFHTQNWDGSNDSGNRVAGGVYLYRLEAPGFTDTKKLVVLD